MPLLTSMHLNSNNRDSHFPEEDLYSIHVFSPNISQEGKICRVKSDPSLNMDV
jgi:hypothetical protein